MPWYVLHKTYAGLIAAYVNAGNKQALEVACKFADWAKKGTDNLNDEQFQKMLLCEFGGMNASLAELYAFTGNKDYLLLARRFDHKAIIDPLAEKAARSGQFELLVLGFSLRLACDLLSAGVGVRTSCISIHSLADAATSWRLRQCSCHLSLHTLH